MRTYFTRERQIALRGAEWKFLTSGGREELYHLSSDPGERRNLASERADVLSDLRPLAQDWITRHQLAAPDPAALSPDEREMLRSLGYLD